MNETAYFTYHENCKKADALVADIRRLYADGGYANIRHMCIRARKDGIISDDEWALIKQYTTVLK